MKLLLEAVARPGGCTRPGADRTHRLARSRWPLSWQPPLLADMDGSCPRSRALDLIHEELWSQAAGLAYSSVSWRSWLTAHCDGLCWCLSRRDGTVGSIGVQGSGWCGGKSSRVEEARTYDRT